MKDEDIQKFLDDNADLMRSLADSLVCPKCRQVVKGEKFNLGHSFNWAEGCKDCANSEE